MCPCFEVSDGSPEEIQSWCGNLGSCCMGDKMENIRGNFPAENSKVCLASFCQKPLIIADEPTGNLDPNSTQELMQLLLKINSLGTTVLLASHNKSIVDKINRRVIELEKGRIIRDSAKGKYTV